MKAYIRAIAYNLPEKVLDNEQIAKEFPEWTVEKINNKIGIKQRHVTVEGETASDWAIVQRLIISSLLHKARTTIFPQQHV